MRKILAIISTLALLFALKETFHIFTTKDAEIIAQRAILTIIALSIILPLAVLSLWLWRPKNNKIENQ